MSRKLFNEFLDAAKRDGVTALQAQPASQPSAETNRDLLAYAVDRGHFRASKCLYPDCNCHFDAPGDPTWCARGFPRVPAHPSEKGDE